VKYQLGETTEPFTILIDKNNKYQFGKTTHNPDTQKEHTSIRRNSIKNDKQNNLTRSKYSKGSDWISYSCFL
jgi:hypothetical protein